jgi:ribosomal protein S18 acetylase RimI-like enzyme
MISIEMLDVLAPADLHDLCDSTELVIEQGGVFGWIKPPSRDVLERYWKGVLMVPERHLVIARLDGIVCGAVQVVEPGRHNEAQASIVNFIICFVSPWARKRGIGKRLLETAEKLAGEMGYKTFQMDVRETQTTAIHLYEKLGYTRWGVNPCHVTLDGKMIAGYHYSKTITAAAAPKVTSLHGTQAK